MASRPFVTLKWLAIKLWVYDGKKDLQGTALMRSLNGFSFYGVLFNRVYLTFSNYIYESGWL